MGLDTYGFVISRSPLNTRVWKTTLAKRWQVICGVDGST